MKKFLILILFFFMNLTVFAEQNSIILPSQLGKVIEVQYVDIDDSQLNQVKQVAKVEILKGQNKGQVYEVDNMLTGNPYYDIPLKYKMKVILHAEEDGGEIVYSIQDVKRSDTLLFLSLLFCGLLIYVGKKKGIYSIISIAITVVLITHMLVPLVLYGVNPILATIVVCVLSTIITMFFVGGFNAKSLSASLGTMLSIVVACILAFISIKTANLTGFANEQTLYLFAAQPQLDFIAITIATILLATLGAVMDVAMSIASTINEILEVDNDKSIKELFASGMNVGRDIIGTMANTLILVYLGGSLPILLLANNIDLQKFINLNQVVTEIVAALIGSIAIVVCVPITAIVASELIKVMHSKKNLNNITLD